MNAWNIVFVCSNNCWLGVRNGLDVNNEVTPLCSNDQASGRGTQRYKLRFRNSVVIPPYVPSGILCKFRKMYKCIINYSNVVIYVITLTALCSNIMTDMGSDLIRELNLTDLPWTRFKLGPPEVGANTLFVRPKCTAWLQATEALISESGHHTNKTKKY